MLQRKKKKKYLKVGTVILLLTTKSNLAAKTAKFFFKETHFSSLFLCLGVNHSIVLSTSLRRVKLEKFLLAELKIYQNLRHILETDPKKIIGGYE